MEHVQDVGGEEYAVGLHRETDGYRRLRQPPAENGEQFLQSPGPEKQRLAAVQHDPDVGQIMGRGVLGNAVSDLHGDGRFHHAWLVTPAGVGGVVDVAVTAVQVAAAVHFEDELP